MAEPLRRNRWNRLAPLPCEIKIPLAGISAEDLSAFERKTGALPADYRNFLQATNGGEPRLGERHPCFALVRTHDEWGPIAGIERFYPLKLHGKDELPHYWRPANNGKYRRLLAIAESEQSSRWWIEIGGANAGRIWYANFDGSSIVVEDLEPQWQAESFTAWVKAFRPGTPSDPDPTASPLNQAVDSRDAARAKALLATGADPHARFGKEWCSPSESAMQRDYPELVELFLQHNRAALQDGRERTWLYHCAAHPDSFEIAQKLGGKLTVRNRAGQEFLEELFGFGAYLPRLDEEILAAALLAGRTPAAAVTLGEQSRAKVAAIKGNDYPRQQADGAFKRAIARIQAAPTR